MIRIFIRFIISQYFDILTNELYNQGINITDKDALKPPPGYIRIEAYNRRKKPKPTNYTVK